MNLFTLEQSKTTYGADFVLYGIAMVGLVALLLAAPRQYGLENVALALGGLLSWSAIEYALHRFVLHGLRPFSRWHAEHHLRPTALICSPTILSAILVVMLVYLPALALGGIWRACALTLGVLTGYLAYSITHHATHHWHAENAWLKERKRWHALHHHIEESRCCYGVTSAFWDHVCGTDPGPRKQADY